MTPPAGRPRKKGNEWLPPHVKCDRHGYYYRNEMAKEYTRLRGENNAVLTRSASRAEVYAAYDRITKPSDLTLGAVLDQYLTSLQYKDLRPATRRDYAQYAVKLRAVFGKMHPDTITSPMIQKYMDVRGAKHPTAANHEKAFLGIIMNWGKARGLVTIPNPCDSVKNIKTESKAKYIEDGDYFAFYSWLMKHDRIMYLASMEIAYLCGSRQQDVLRLLEHRPFRPKADDCWIMAEGLHIWQAKTGKVQLKEWSPRLKAAVELAKGWKKGHDLQSQYLICTRSGTRFTRGGFNAIWIREQKDAQRAGHIVRFRFHDLKHKGVTDFDGDKQNFSGHATKTMVEKYNHGVDRTATVQKLIPAEVLDASKPNN